MSQGDDMDTSPFADPNPLFGSRAHQVLDTTDSTEGNPLFRSQQTGGSGSPVGVARNPLFGSTILDTRTSSGAGRGRGSGEVGTSSQEMRAHPLFDSQVGRDDAGSASGSQPASPPSRGGGLFSGVFGGRRS